MGPPLFSGGNLNELCKAWHSAFKLQWGRRCSAAEIFVLQSGHIPHGHRLQWGRRCSAAEMPAPTAKRSEFTRLQWGRRCSAAEIRARWSKRPAATARFNGAAAVQRRKCVQRLEQVVARQELQWGRRCSAAEIFVVQFDAFRQVQLQWGRRCSAAEIRRAWRRRHPGETCFNGAAAVQRRK